MQFIQQATNTSQLVAGVTEHLKSIGLEEAYGHISYDEAYFMLYETNPKLAALFDAAGKRWDELIHNE